MTPNLADYHPPRFGAAQFRLLERLTNACGVSGFEHEVRQIVLRAVRPLADRVEVDAIGNVLAIRTGRAPNRLRVMLAAHMDEVGFMLTSKDDNDGSLFRFAAVGGVNNSTIVGKPLQVGKKHIPAVIGTNPVHLSTIAEKLKPIDIDNLRIDLGPGTKAGAQVGDWAVFATRYKRLGPSILAKALDDRLGVANLIELLRNPPENIDILAAFTVQEEVGLRGAGVAAYSFKPDLAIALDCTPARDLPEPDENENTHVNTRLDGGPAIYIADRATLSDPRLRKHLAHTADLLEIPYQFRQPGGGGTDAGAIHPRVGGIPSISLSVPARYAHTPAMLARVNDWKNTLTLLYAALLSLPPDIVSGERGI
jgi:endoglucanase